jgi:hypothetical protein
MGKLLMFIIARLSVDPPSQRIVASRQESDQSTNAADGKGNRLLLSLGIVRWLRLIDVKNAVSHVAIGRSDVAKSQVATLLKARMSQPFSGLAAKGCRNAARTS